MSNQLQITGGAKVRNLEGVITGTSGVLGALPINTASGIPQLDSNGKILVSQLPNSVMEFLGVWNASTNTPYLHDGTGNAGDVYLCNVAGTVNFGSGPITFSVGDYVVYTGSVWARSSGATGTVTSVAISESSAALSITGSPITTSGTINIGFAGTSAQYVAGDGSLITFPALTGYVPYTGATADLNLGLFDLKTAKVWLYDVPNDGYGSMELTDGVLHFEDADGHSMVTMEDGYMTIANASTIRALLDVSGLTSNRDYAFPNASGTLALTSDLSSYVPTSRTISTTAPLQGGGNLSANRTLTITQASSTTDGYLSSTDWNIFNGKQAQINGTGFVKASGTTISYDNSTYVTTNTTQTITGAKTFNAINTFNSEQDFNGGIYLNNALSLVFGATASVGGGTFGLYSSKATTTSSLILLDGDTGFYNKLSFNNASNKTFTFPNASGTIALTSDIPSLSGYVQGTGTTNYLPKFTGISTIGNSAIYDNGGNIGIGTTTADSKFKVIGTIYSDNNGLNNFALNSSGTDYGFIQNTAANTWSLGYGTSLTTLGSAALTWNKNGNVQIGTTTDAGYKLDVNGTGRVSGALTGTQATFTHSSGETIVLSKGTGPSIKFSKTNATAQDWALAGETNFKLYDYTAGTVPFQIAASTGAATFSSSVTADGATFYGGSSTANVKMQKYHLSGNPYTDFVQNNDAYTWTKGRIISVDGQGSNYYGGGLAFYTNAGGTPPNSITERMRIQDNGNVGIGTSSPFSQGSGATTMELAGNTYGQFFVSANSASIRGVVMARASTLNDVYIASITNSPLLFGTNDTERMRITSSGWAGFNTPSVNRHYVFSNPANRGAEGFEINAQSGIVTFLSYNRATNTYLPISLSEGTSNVLIGTTTDNGLGKLQVNGGIYAFKDNGYGLILDRTATTNYNGISYRTSNSTKWFVGMRENSTNDYIIYSENTGVDVLRLSNTTNTATFYGNLTANGNILTGQITSAYLGTGTVYSNSGLLTNTNPSDRRLKQNITPITYGLNEVLQLNPVSFDWKNDNNKNKQFGFIAQEVQEVMPEAVIQGEYLGLEKDAIYTALVNAIKELKQEIETLKIK